MDGKYKFSLVATALILLCVTLILALLIMILWPERHIVGWIVLDLAGVTILVLLAMWMAQGTNEMILRHKRYQHGEETPLDQDGYPTHLQAGEQVYQRPVAQVREVAYPYD
jgi:hypothetical protein